MAFRRLGRPTDSRQALFRALTTELVRLERIRTTLPKAKEVRRFAERVSSHKIASYHDCLLLNTSEMPLTKLYS